MFTIAVVGILMTMLITGWWVHVAMVAMNGWFLLSLAAITVVAVFSRR